MVYSDRMKPGIDYIGVCVAFYLHDGQGNFLLHKRSQSCRDEQGTWDFGGGQVEFGETPAEAVAREVREEYGCEVTITEELPTVSAHRTLADGTPTHWLALCFVGTVDRSQAKIGEPKSMDEIGWFPIDALPSPLHSAKEKHLKEQSAYFDRYKKARP